MPLRSVTLSDVQDAGLFRLVNSLHKVYPGIVVAYHPSAAGSSPATVDVQPAINDVRFDPVLGTRVSEPWPVVPNVPVAWLNLAGCTIAGALAAGDDVTLLSFDLDPTQFFATGKVSDPVDTRRHGGGYWLAVPFSLRDAFAVTDPGGNLVFTGPRGGGTIVFGEGATAFVALASLVNAELGKIADAFKSFVPGTGGASFTEPYTTAGDVSSTLVKAK